jgi:methionyl-tRNA formyltransferase
MTKELDAGNVIYQEAITIDENETYQSLYSKLSQLAYDTLKKQINNLFQTNIPSQPQDAKLVTIAKNISRDDEKIS